MKKQRMEPQGMKLTPGGLALAVQVLNRDGSVDAAGVTSDPRDNFSSMLAIAERFLHQSRQLGNARTEQEKTDCMLICIFRAWCEDMLKRGFDDRQQI